VEFDEVLRRRRMVRHYTDEPVSDEDLNRLLWAAQRSPSAGFTQGCGFLVLRTPDERGRFWATSPLTPANAADAERTTQMQEAPLLIVPMYSEAAYLARYSQADKARPGVPSMSDAASWAVPYWLVDAAFAAMLIQLEAVNLGLGALFMGLLPEMLPPFRAAFGVPDAYKPIGAILVGHRHPDVLPNPRHDRRKAPSDVTHFGGWGRARHGG
jgi:nitroreductase